MPVGQLVSYTERNESQIISRINSTAEEKENKQNKTKKKKTEGKLLLGVKALLSIKLA